MKSNRIKNQVKWTLNTKSKWYIGFWVIYFLGALTLNSDITTEVTEWGPYEFIIKYVFLPVLIIFLFAFSSYFKKNSLLGLVSVFTVACFFCFGFLLFLGPYLTFVNAYFGPQQVMELSGPVVKKTQYRQKQILTFYCTQLNRQMSFNIQRGGVKRPRVGDHYVAWVYRGSLGFYYLR